MSQHLAAAGAARPRFTPKYGLLVLLVLYSFLGLLYDFSVPLFEKPDELKHFALIQFIQTRRQLPLVEAGVYKPWDQEGTQPPLYHILAALTTSWLDLSGFEEPPRNPHYVDDRSFIWRERGNNNLYLHPPGEALGAGPVIVAARLARWLSLLAGLGAVILTYFLARLVFNRDLILTLFSQFGQSENRGFTAIGARLANSLPLLAAALVAFIPQFLHVTSAITNDSLSVTLAAAALLLLALLLKDGLSTRYTLYLGIILGLAAITKLSLLYLWLLVGVAFVIDFSRYRSLRRLVRFGAILGLLMALLAGWWYWRNWQLYGDPTALNAHLLYRGGPLNPRPSLAQIWQTEMVGLELSFWAAFGAGQILLEPWLYTLLRSIKYLVLIGLFIGVWRTFRAGEQRKWGDEEIGRWGDEALAREQGSKGVGEQGSKGVEALAGKGSWGAGEQGSRGVEASAGLGLFESAAHHGSDRLRSSAFAIRHSSLITHHSSFIILALLLLWSLIIFLALLRWMQITPASWGRLLFPSLPALAILSAWSLSHFGFWILDFGLRATGYGLRATHYVLRPITLYFPWLLVLLLFTLSLISPFRYLQAAYAKTPLIAETDIPAEGFQRLDFFYGAERLRLIGYRVEKSQVEPGDWLPVTLYWQATRPVGKNYTTFVHLLDRQGEAIGQANTYPDGGNWPTSMLPPGGVLAATYYVLVSPEAEAPQLTRLAFGLFEFEDQARAAKAVVNGAGEPVEPIVEGIPLLPRQWPVLAPGQPLEADFGGQIRLTGYDPINEKRVRPGTQVPITFYWETLAAPGRDLNLFIHLVDSRTQAQVAGFDGPPPYPTRLWQPGQTFIDARLLALPAGLPSGDYELWIGWYSLDDFARLPLHDGEGDALQVVTIAVESAAEESRD